MNHIYKSIFNKALGVFTAVPEFASAHGKGSERTVVGRVAKGTAGFAASALAISVGLALTSTSAVAAPGIYINDKADPSCLAVPDSPPPYVGINGIANNQVPSSLSILGPSQTPPPPHYYALDSMNPCLSSTGANATEHFSTQTNRTLFYGTSAPATVENNGSKNLTLGGRLDVNSGIIGVGDRGTNGAGATNSIRMGTGTTLDNANKIENAISIGVDAGVNGISSIAIGDGAKSGGKGANDPFDGDAGLAIGHQAQGLGTGAVAIGQNASVQNGHDSIAMGVYSKTSNPKAISIGAYNEASGVQSTVIGSNFDTNSKAAVSTASGTRSQVYGVETTVSGNNSVSIGDTNTIASARTYALGNNINVAAGTDDSLVFGTRAAVGGNNAIAMGNTAAATSNYATAIGVEALAHGSDGALAVGRKATANANAGAMAIGFDAVTTGKSGIAQGYHAHTNAQSGLAIGDNAKASGIGQVAVGYASNAQKADIDKAATAAPNKADYAVTIGHYAGADYTGTNNIRSTLVGDSAGRYGEEGTQNTAVGSLAGMYVKGSNNVALGIGAGSGSAADKLVVNNTTAIGNAAKALTSDSIAIGTAAKSGKADKFSGERAVAIGYNAQALGSAGIAIGEESATTNGHNGVAIGAYSKTSNEKAISIGAFNAATGAQSIVMAGNYDTNSSGPVSVASGTRATVIGAETTVSGNNSLAIGDKNTVASNRTYAIGNNINVAAGASDSLVFGTKASVGGPEAIALGNTANSKTDGAISIGAHTVSGDGDLVAGVEGNKSISIGYESIANRYDTIAMGVQASTQAADSGVAPWDAVAIGSKSKATTYKALAIGAYSQATGRQSTVIGNDIQGQNSTASGERSQILGVQSNVSGDNSVSIGDTNNVAAARTYVMGNNINVDSDKAVDSLAFGTSANVKGQDQISIGHNAGADAVATAKNAYGIALGLNAGRYQQGGEDNYAIGQNAGQYVNGTHSVALGLNAGSHIEGDGNFAAADGAGNYIKGRNNIAIGNNAGSGAAGAIVEADRTISVGTRTQARGDNAVAIGTDSKALAVDATAVGQAAQASAEKTVAVGQGAKATERFTVAMGHNATASHANSVALGTNSATSDAHTGDYTLNMSYTAAGLPNAANGTVSVGSAGKERQIQNVAAGVISATSTDAINGSQLYATNNYLSNLAGGVKNVLGGNAAVDNAGNVTMSNIGETGEGTVHGAIKNLKDAIDSKVDTTASVTSEDPADIKVEKEAPVGNTTNYKLSLGDDAKAKLAKAATALQTVEGDSNITATKDATDPTKVKLALNKDLTADSVTLGDKAGDHAVVNKDGLTIANGPSVKKDGINAGDKKITGVADGNVAAGSKDAVNGGQLAEVKAKADSAVQDVVSSNPTALTANKVGNTVTLTPNFIAGDLVNADGTVNAPATADEGKLVSAKTVADALKANHFVVDTKGNTETGSEADAKVGSGNKVTFEAGNNLVAKQANTANGGATVKFSLKDDISLNSVTAGTGANQVVLGNDGVKVGGNTYINNDGLNANSKVISNVADGVNPNDAVNKSQLDAVKGVADSAVKSVDTVAGEENLVVDNNDPQNPKLRLKKAVNLTSIKLDGATPGNTTYVSGYGLTIEDGPSVKKEGINAGDKKITNVAAGDVSATSKDAVNGAQLHNVASSVANVLGGNAAVDGNGNVTSSDIGGTGANTVDDAIKAVNATAAKHTTVVEGKNVKVTKGKNAAGGDEYTVATKDDLDVTSVTAGNTTVNTNGLTITGGPSVTRGGIDAGNAVITNVRDGKVEANSKDAVNGGQLHATNTKLDGVKAKADTAVQDVKSGDENALTTVKDPNTNIVTVTPKLSGDLVDANGNITAPTTPAEKGKLVTAGTVAQALANTHFVVDTKATDGELDTASQADQKIKAGNKVTLQAGKNLKAKQTNAADGAQVEFSLKDSISLTEVTAGTGDNQVVLGNNGVQVGGNTYINKDGLNANSKVISNVADGVNPNDAVNKGQLDAVKGVADSAVKSVDVANGEQNLVVDNTDPKNPKLSLKKDLTVDSVKAGDSTLNTDGLTIAGGPSVKKDGIDAGDKKITGVADGNVAAGSTDAVNGGQLYNVANNVKDLIGPDAAIDPATGKVTVADPAKGIGETGKGTIGDAIKHVNDAAKAAADTAKKHTTVEQGDNIVVEESLNADGGKHYKVSTAKDLNVDSVKAGDTTVNNDGVTIAGGPSVTKGGINAGGNTITNVADGVNPNDAVNKGQLDAVKNVADSAVKSVDVANGEQNLVVDNSDPKNPKLSLKKDLTVDSVTAGDSTLNNDGLTIAGGPSVKKDGIDAADKKITNVAAGDVAENSKDAVNGGQLYDVAKNVADLVGPDAKIDPATGKVTVTDPAKGIGETGKGNIGDAIKHVNDLAKNAADTAKKHTTVEQGDNIVVEESTNADGGKHYKVSTAKDLNVDSVKAGDTTVNNDGVTIAGGPSVTKGGINAGGNTITNVADGVNPDDAVNKGQLDKVDTKVSNVAQNVVNVLGGDATVNGNGDITMTNIGETGKGNINDAIKSVNDLAKKAAAEKTSVKAKEGRSNVTVTEGVNAAGGHEYTVDVERSVTNAGSNYVTVTNNHDADTNTTTYTVDVSAKTKASLAKADSAVQGLTSKDGNLNFTKGANGNVEVSFNDNLNVKNVTTDRVQVANGPSMSKDGINAAGKAISNVANGNVAADSKDAVNGGQLHETAKSVADVIGGGATVKDGKVVAGQNGIGNTGQNTVHGAIAAINQNTANNFNQIRGDLRKMDRDLRGGIAGALATAGLPQAFRPGKSMVAAAASTYRGQSGLAIGVSRISDNGKVILKVTGNTNSRGDFGGTIGAGYQW
ncbi:YadA-like family protein [Aggregatibacter sp. 2125159857]|uniref:YadA-like family protein n=1 Tax=Aggregatibacter sp. 2125159857 TaxID=2820817 RepID=UPI001ADECF90|nr:YadA-like family protein [Aggregatibacter sp. 2125159857]QTO01518.1 YadA-like family protein [Aggregatibacter sp. 2125159857]